MDKKEIFDDHPLKNLVDEKVFENDIIPNFTIVYATQSNTAKRFSEKISKDAEYLNIKNKIINISEITIEDFNKNIFLVFFISTYGEGGPSDDAIEFNRLIDNKTLLENLENKNVHFSIFGLGSTKYEYYNQMAKKIDKYFTKNKIIRISEVGMGDDSKNINKDFDEWRKNFWVEAYNLFNSKKDEIKKLSQNLNLKELYEKHEDEYKIFSNKTTDENITKYANNLNIEDYDYATRRFLEAKECEIKEIKELRKETINGSTLLVKYSCDIKYKVGDNIGVFPVNNENVVNEIISKLNFDQNEKFQIKKNKETVIKQKANIPDSLTVKEILTNLVDLSCQIK